MIRPPAPTGAVLVWMLVRRATAKTIPEGRESSSPCPETSFSCHSERGCRDVPTELGRKIEPGVLSGGLKALQHLFGMARGVDLGIDRDDRAVGSDEITDPPGIGCVSTIARPIEKTHSARRVAEQRKVEIEFLRERAIVLFRVEADAENLSVLLFVEAELVAEPATFGGSAGGVRLGIEPENDVFSAVVGESDEVPLVIPNLEIRCGRALLEHG